MIKTYQLASILILCLFINMIDIVDAAPLPPNQTVRITAEIGENYVQWLWKFDNGTLVTDPVTIYIDDATQPVVTNYTRASYLQLNLKPNERHNIALYDNSSSLLARATAITTTGSTIIFFLLGLCLVIMIVVFILQDLVRFLLLAIFNIVLSMYSSSLSSGHGSIPYAFFGIAIITGTILLVNGLPRLRELIDWW